MTQAERKILEILCSEGELPLYTLDRMFAVRSAVGGFALALGELLVSGLVEKVNGRLSITDAGKRALAALVRVRFDPEVFQHLPESRYDASARLSGELAQWTLGLKFDTELSEGEWETFAYADFLANDAPHQLLQSGAKLELIEGTRVVATLDVITSSGRIGPSEELDTDDGRRKAA